MEQLLSWDGIVFHLINHTWHNPFLDAVMPRITELGSGGAVWLFALFLLAIFGKGEGRKIAFLGTIALVFSWLISDEILKGLFARPRPFLHFSDTILLVAGPKQYSFPSGHATTAFAPATAIWLKNHKLGVPVLVLAVIIGFSRIYVGVHYPLDVLGGVILGVGMAILVVSQESLFDKIVIAIKRVVHKSKQTN